MPNPWTGTLQSARIARTDHQNREGWLYVAEQNDIDGFVGDMQHVPQAGHKPYADCEEEKYKLCHGYSVASVSVNSSGRKYLVLNTSSTPRASFP